MVKKIKTSVSLKKREGYRSSVKSLLDRLTEISQSDSKTDLELSALLKKLNIYASLIDDLNIEIENSISEDQIDAELAENQKISESIWDGQNLAQSLLDASVKQPSEGEIEVQTASTVSRTVRVKLPKLELCSFDGNPLQWQEFFDSFDTTIHSNEDISVIDKFKYLKMYLKGDALRVVDGFRLTTANYSAALARLKERFGEPETVKFAHFESLLSLPIATADTHSLEETYDQSEKHIRSLVALGLGEDTFGQVFAPILLSKLPWPVRVALHRQNGSNTWTLSNLRLLLGEEIQARKRGDWTMGNQREPSLPKARFNKESKGPLQESGRFTHSQRPSTTGALVHHSKPGMSCTYCKGDHFPDECKKVSTQAGRKAAIKGQCFKCLGKGHMVTKCPKSDRKCFHCGGTSHHRSLCNSLFPPKSNACLMSSDPGERNSQLDPKAVEFQPKTEITALSGNTGKGGLVQMQMATVYFPPSNFSARVFLDTGSSRSYITSSLCKRLGLKPVGKEFIGNTRFEETTVRTRSYDRVIVKIPTKDGNFISVPALVTDNITGPVQKQAIATDRHLILLQLELADTITKQPQQVFIDILIGSDCYYQIIGKERIDLDDGLILLESKLGYVTTGVLSDRNGHSQSTLFVSSLLSVDHVSVSHDNCQVERFWQLEDIGIKDRCDQNDDEVAAKCFNDTLARGRLKSVVRGLNSNQSLLKAYDSVIQEQFNDGVIEKVPDKPEGELTHYLPHHCVIKPNCSTTKVRVVYDASARCSKYDHSLNDCLLRGPVFIQQLPALILRFRQNPVAIMADIERAFLQVGLQSKDRDVTRFLWLDDLGKPVTDSNLVEYRFCRVPFGIVSSPFLLDATIRYHLQQKNDPAATKLLEHMYVDNFLGGVHTTQEAFQFFEQAKLMMGEISMNIREWFSNDDQFIRGLPEFDRGTGHTAKVLGMLWDTKSDKLSFADPKVNQITVTTKRSLVQSTSRVFDPCGFLAPVLVTAKLLVQETWKSRLAWNGKLSEDLISRWKMIAEELEQIPTITIPRYLSTLTEIEIHCFCDASSKAYAAAIYVKSTHSETSPFLVFAKSKLAPLKDITIPRLELMAAVVGIRLIRYIRSHTPWNGRRTVLWSDSKCVLAWIRSQKVLTVFVQNRVSEIRAEENVEFRYVPTQSNPADLPSRGTTVSELKEMPLWWNGPSFLTKSETEWPQIPTDDVVSNQENEGIGFMLSVPQNSQKELLPPFGLTLDRFSSLTRPLRVTALCTKAVDKFLGRTSPESSESTQNIGGNIFVTAADITKATNMWVRWAQQFPSSAETKNLHKQLAVFKDDYGILRCGGRLSVSDLPPDSKFPVLLPSKHVLTKLIIQNCHERVHHAGAIQTLAQLRSQFWVPRGRAMVNAVVRQCQHCRITQGGPYRVPQFPPFPSFRVTQSPPFTYTGIDYLGPLFVESASTEPAISKTWICLFTCAATRAIHLEVVRDMTARSFLLCLRRFVSIHQAPAKIISDNAKQFKTANTVLRKIMAEIQSEATVQSFSAPEGIEWKFIPEFSPWMGGFYERLVGTVKKSLKRVLFRRMVQIDELQTVVAEISRMVNSRPLVLASEPGEMALSPNDLLGRSQRSLPNVSVEDVSFSPETPKTPDDLLQMWRRSNKLLNQFWHIWRSAYLTALRDYKLSFKDRGAVSVIPEIGHVVLIKDENLSRSQWKTAVIQSLVTSTDGEKRSAVVRLSSGKCFTRPLRLLYPIETSVHPQQTMKQTTRQRLPTQPRSSRPVRSAAKTARTINRLLTTDLSDEDSSAENSKSEEIVNSSLVCCIAVDNSTSNRSFQDQMTMASSVTIHLDHKDPLGPKWRGTSDPNSGNFEGLGFYLNQQFMTSVEMAYWYLQLKVNGCPEWAREMTLIPGLLNDPVGIASWIQRLGFKVPATWVFQAEHVYFAVMVQLVADQNNLFSHEVQRLIDKYPDKDICFVLHSGNHDYIWSSGFRKASSIPQEFGKTTGQNLYGHLLTRLVSGWKAKEFNCLFTVDDLLNNDYHREIRPPETVLILSDSYCRQLEWVQSSVPPIKISGGKYHDAAREMAMRGINPLDFCYICIHIGINHCKSHDTAQWQRSWRQLEDYLSPAIGIDSPTQIIIDTPIFHPSRPIAQAHAKWIQNKVRNLPNITLLDLSQTEDNPFLDANQQINFNLFAKDQFHLNHSGFRMLWTKWCQCQPELETVSYRLSSKYYKEPVPATLNKQLGIAATDGQGTSSWPST